MLQSVSAASSTSPISRPHLVPETKPEIVALTTQKGNADTAEFSSAALKSLASEADGG